ncbi:DUF2637 domain-containing protein [Streptomyces sp. NPDC059679]|uniref:DUF2637 domain-containing protein n=1 Tax=Streptomyces sp. NPDC059679 TaxID=3346903 RepID=UPI00367654B8
MDSTPRRPAETASADGGPAAPARWVAPALNRFEWFLVVLVGLGALAVGGIGLYSSYSNVTSHMAEQGFEHPSLVPISVDIAIPVFGLAYLLLIRLNMGLAWVRWVPYVLTGVTIYLNVTSTDQVDAQVAHAALPALWVAFTEVVAHAYRTKIGEANGTRTDPIPAARWFLAPLPTFFLWRRMKLWQVTSYAQALNLERDRIHAVTALRDRYGRGWRRKTRLDMKAALRLGELTAEMVRSAQPGQPLPSPRRELAATLTPAPARRELQNAEEQQALPVGEQAISTPEEGDAPYRTTENSLVENSTWDSEFPQPVETREEREQREQREEEETDRRTQANYDKAVEVVLELVALGERVSGQRVAEDDRVPVGPRSVQRYVKKMVRDGIISPEVIA